MNKRQAKKKQRKEEMFVISFCSSYREVKELDRNYHIFCIECERERKYKEKKGIPYETPIVF